MIAEQFRSINFQVFEEVHGLADNGSTRRIDMISIPPNNNNGFIINPTVRFEKQKSQPEDVNREKNDIYCKQEFNQTYESVAVPNNCPWNTLTPAASLDPMGNMLDAVNYYAEHYGKITEVIDALDNTDSSGVAAVKSLPSEQLLEDIPFIDSNFKIAPKSITLLESSKLQPSEALNIVDKVSQTFKDTIKELKWETLENRRRKTRITSLYRAHLDQKAWVDITARLEKPTYYGRNDHDFKIKCRKQKTDVASKAISLEVNPEKTKYMIMSRDQNIVRNGNIKIGDLSFEEVEKFKYLGATVTNINDTREEIKRRINMGNACYYSVEKLLTSSLLSKNLKVRIYITVILPVVLYGCETWTLTLREEHRLRVFENKVLGKIFGAKRDEATGEWRKLHNAELHALYSSPDIIRNIKSRRLRWAGHVARMGESRNAYRVLVGRPEGKRPLGRPRRRWEDNIKMDLREVGYDDRDCINLAQDRDRWRAYVRAAIFFDSQGLMHHEFIPEGRTVTKELYVEILRRLWDAVRRKRPEKWVEKNWFLMHDNAPAHRAIIVKNFLARHNITALDHPPYSPDLSPPDYFLFPRLKSHLKGRRFNAEEVIANATRALRRVSQNGFQACFQELYTRWQKCVVAEGNYFEGNAVE
ncbi:hypothetical protein ANN_08868 [Periplaneta americana]|uniref:Tc1-like transposase DDE domain-containing protein n=1 Tax=Periplaneta americana TaxID=6978 RepID=A0ABQ8T4A7_PERAM|nr:hypothetical protein ANN_08868 [Periplaneta americana]